MVDLVMVFMWANMGKCYGCVMGNNLTVCFFINLKGVMITNHLFYTAAVRLPGCPSGAAAHHLARKKSQDKKCLASKWREERYVGPVGALWN